MSIYSRATIGEPDNQLVLNDTTTNPYFRVRNRAPEKYQIRQEDVPIPFQSGISDFLTLIGETVYVINGVMYPSDEQSYDNGLSAIRAVSSLDLEQTDPFAVDEGYVPYIWGDSTGALTKQIFLKILYAQLKEDTHQGFVMPFSLICKIKDPTIYGGTLKTASTQASDVATTTGNAKYPFTYPVAFGSTNFAVSGTANNVGNIPSYPNAITVYGPVNNPKVTNIATGEFIQVNVNMTSSSDTLVIQYSADTLSVLLNGVNNTKNVSSDSTYFKVHPGINTIQLSGSSIGTGSYVTMTYYDSYALA